ncbi:MAG: hypothetical protein R3343_11795 [Nitriliruptorales bacterium]|nr:hypothetical protein [Nitriliruptorales bacterium]
MAEQDENESVEQDEVEHDEVEEVASSSSHEDDEVSGKDGTDPDPDVGDTPKDDDLTTRPIAWRPGRRHGRSAEPERRDDD